jgi:PAS domain S-box-containing protein
MTGKIVFVAPDKDLTNKAKQIISKLGDEIEVYQGSLSEGLKLAEKAVENGANLVISRGGTGNLIKNNLQIPVVILETGAYDIINSINEAVSYSSNIGIVGFENLVIKYEKVKEIMQNIFNAKIVTVIVKNDIEVDIKIKQLYESGIRVFIGGQAVISATQRHGYNGVLIESGEEAIVEAIKYAKNLLEVQLKEKEKAQILKSIIDFAYDGIIGMDKDGKITVFNPVAEKITGVSAETAIGRPVDDMVENTRMNYVLKSGEAELGEIQRIGEISIVTNRVPIVVEGEVLGVVATFQELDKIQKMESKIRKKLLYKGHIAKARFEEIVGNSTAVSQAKEEAKQYAEVDSTVLILGETGTGKELFAQSIHNASNRNDKPFVAVNCAALPENLLESELFGYVEGAFTGARKGGKTGLFELAHEGTIFLDEISEMSPMLQARFLRVLQEKEVVRLGDDRIIPIDIRIIAATNRDLYSEVEKGGFREDLYYRLCVLRLEIPPLRKRPEDIPALVDYFIEEKGRRLGKSIKSISREAISKLVNQKWPGNIRQLENVVERIVVLCKKDTIDADIVSEVMGRSSDYSSERQFNAHTEVELNDGLLKNVEAETIRKVLEETNGNKTQAAEKLGISVTTLWRRLKKLE